ncbi:MAG TPA: carboxypeptidase-like regulatory domain-containing protein [Candidatus Acidoferrales bacterium]|nr:carboxypeptidase-like regulatory domain-containing protein [Candidatus Acidoferrales bacterium]
MASKRAVFTGVILLLALTLAPAAAFAQSATTGLVSGTVLDPSGAAIPGAKVSLEQSGTSLALTAQTGATGRYVFPAVTPGDYTLRVAATGFQTGVIAGVHVDVQKSYTQDIQLKVGQTSQTVEVTATTGAVLQTTSATVGTVLGGISLQRLPVFTRSASALMFLQPAVAPTGQVAGARDEEVTFSLDGGDVTSDLEGSNSYASPPGEPGVSPTIPIPQESTQEFQVATTNPNATFDRSAGGQVSLLTQHGTNSYHGTAYEYHNDDALNANGWTNNRLGIAKPHSVDNRFGFTFGGPFLKNHFWFFSNYEGRRFHDSTIINRIVPTATMKNGILEFPDAKGNLVAYPLQPGNITTACGGNPCDPRQAGMSPVIKSQLALYPGGNNPALGDGFNTTGFTFDVPTPISQNLAVLRLDYKVNDKWSTFVTYHYSRTARVGTEQIDILGSAPASVAGDPIYPGFATFEVTGQITPGLTVVTHGSYLRNWWGWNRQAPNPLVSGTTAALELAGEGVGNSNSLGKLLADPIGLNTQGARSRVYNGHKWYLAQDLSWVHGHHLVQFGASGYISNDLFDRTDNFAGGLTTGPINYIESTGNGSGEFVTVPAAFQPTPCGGAVSTGCLPASQISHWNQLYATLLGLVDRSSQVETRNGTFQPNPLGTPVFAQTTIPAVYTYVQDIWQLRPSLTATVGLDWGVQPTPSEANGKEVLLTYANTNTPVDYVGYLQSRENSLNNGVLPGQAFNPLFGVTPVDFLPHPFQGKLRVTDWHEFGPRVSLAWQVPFKNRFFGDHQTVVRGGYSIVYSRTNNINQVSLPLTTGGLIDVDACGGPVLAAGTVQCTNGPTNPTNAFRIGVDGSNAPIPAPVAQPIPFVPSGTQAQPFGLFLQSGLDPFGVPGYMHSVDFTIQRALPGQLVVEAGFIGRYSHNLTEDLQLNIPDYLMKDKQSGQTYAQAFDALAQALRSNSAVPDEAFFDNQIGLAKCTGAGFANCSAMVAAKDRTDLINGNLNSFAFSAMNLLAPVPIDNIQSFLFFGISDGGFSSYNGAFVSLDKHFSSGLQFQFNWTWSHSIGNQGVDQQNGSGANSSYNLNLDKSSEPFDQRHVFNSWWYYQLPFGKGGKYLHGNKFMDPVLGNWYVSGIWTYTTGIPLHVNADGNYGAFESSGTAAISSMRLHGQEGLNGNVVGSSGIAVSGNASKHGSGLNLFADPVAVFNSLSRPLLSVNTQIPFDELRMLPSWNVDFAVGKTIAATERYQLTFSAQFFNFLNQVTFNPPSLDMASSSNFGVLTSQANNPRRMLVGLQFKF